jgi:hypothetical protein
MGPIGSVDTMILGANTCAQIFQDRQDLELVEATPFDDGLV